MPRLLVIHSANSLIPRRIIVPEHDHEIEDVGRHLQPGETGFHMEHADFHSAHVRHHVAVRHGKEAADIPSGRCIVVDDTGTVIATVMADPEIDKHPDGTLIASDTLGIGDRHS